MSRGTGFSIVLCLVLGLIGGQGLNAETSLNLTKGIKSYSAGTHLYYLQDESGSLNFEQIRSAENRSKFIKNDSSTLNKGFTTDTYWIRLPVRMQAGAAKRWLMEISYPPLDHIEIYLPPEYKKIVTGDIHDASNRPINHRNYVIPVELKAETEQIIYLRVNTKGSLQVPISIYEPNYFLESVQLDLAGFGVFFGIMLIMGVYNFFLYLSTRDINYLYYVLYVIAFIGLQLSLDGLGPQYIWGKVAFITNHSVPAFIGLVTLTVMNFSRHFLNARKLSPVWWYIFQGFMLLALLNTLLSLVLPYRPSIILNAVGALIAPLIMLVAGVITYFKGYRPARYYLISWTVFLVGTVIFALSKFGVLPSLFLTDHAQRLGSLANVLLLSFALGDRINTLQREKRKAVGDLAHNKTKMLNFFSQFVPRQFIELLNKESYLEIGKGDVIEKELTILFSDIRNFTALSEEMSPEQNFKFLNHYLGRMSPMIHKYNGFIDKFIGDAIMALFPISPLDAIRAAVEMRKELYDYNSHRARFDYPDIDMGVGIHVGSVMLGTLGDDDRMDTTVIGDHVNIAARIEGLTKTFNIPILISDKVYQSLTDKSEFHIRTVDSIRVKGKKDAITIYEVFNADHDKLLEQKLLIQDSFAQAQELYRQGDFLGALALFKSNQDKAPEDHLQATFIKRCEKLIANPPGPKWSGTSRMLSK